MTGSHPGHGVNATPGRRNAATPPRSGPGKRWQDPDFDREAVQRVAEDLRPPFPVAAALAGRGLTTGDAVEQFLHPRLSELSDPMDILGMETALVRIWDAIDARESIVIFGDYDVDGVSSTALLVSFFSDLGAFVTPYLPNRITDGYGFTPEILARCIDELRPDLIITVDCGTGSVDAVQLARDRGIDVVVTDHHEPSAEIAPALSVVNPKLGEAEDVRMLAGVGVAFKLCHGILKVGLQQKRSNAESVDLRAYLDLVALGTVADIVPLLAENRILAQYGLKRLASPRCLGLKTLIDVVGIRDEVQAHHVGFQLGPRLNAAGRMGDAHAALELLLTEDEERARALAMKLDAANRERQEIENRIVREAREEIDQWFDPDRHFGLVVGREGWHLGVIGIVASRLSQLYYRPVVVIGFNGDGGRAGTGRGSCRSIEGFDLMRQLELCSDLLAQFGGHNMAAGLEIRASDLEPFKERFNQVAGRALTATELRPVQRIDAWLDLAEVDNWLFDTQQTIRPFGHSNPSPVWAARNLRVVRHRIVGRGHLQMTVAAGGVQVDAIGFGLGDREMPRGPIDVAFQLKKSTYMGRESLRLDVQDFRPAEPA